VGVCCRFYVAVTAENLELEKRKFENILAGQNLEGNTEEQGKIESSL
jgi:hypothetical protein